MGLVAEGHKTMTQLPQHFEAQITRMAQLDYLLYLPSDYSNDSTQHWPLILFLHGAGGRGRDLELVKREGIPHYLDMGHDVPFIVVSPQCPVDSHWTLHSDALHALLNDVVRHYAVDDHRLYVTGVSLGGAGTWMLAGAYPEQFAAIALLSSRIVPLPLSRLRTLPIWVFHGEVDEAMPVSETHRTVEALRALGGDVKPTIYPGVGHDTGVQTYTSPELYAWFLSHRRS
jgi:predicted peptidase